MTDPFSNVSRQLFSNQRMRGKVTYPDSFQERPHMDASRIAARYAFETRFRISVERDTRNLAFEGWARDISESGLGAFVGQELRCGADR
jgi:hypothetical protein